MGDYLRRTNSNVKLVYAGMPNQNTFCLSSNKSGLLYFPRDTDKINFYPHDSENFYRVLKVSKVTPKKITLIETVEESDYYSVLQQDGKLRLPDTE